MMHLTDSIKCIYYNLLSNFYITVNIFLPYYSEEILNLQYKTIEHINEEIIFESNSRKRRRFNLFVENLILKNNELIERIKKQEEEDNNLSNYEKIDDENVNEEITEEEDEDNVTDHTEDNSDNNDKED